MYIAHPCTFLFFFFNDTATTEIYTLSLHDALPICNSRTEAPAPPSTAEEFEKTFEEIADMISTDAFYPMRLLAGKVSDRKSTRLNSSHLVISYAVFCLKKKSSNIPLKLTTTSC